MTALILAHVLTVAACLGQEQQGDWVDYRGPTMDGHAREDARPPLDWSEDRHVRWKAAVSGRGWSSPIVTAGRIWFTTADPEGHERRVICHDFETGDVLLDRVLLKVANPEERNPLNSYASPSATAGQGRVFFSFGSAGLICLNAESGDEEWRRTDLPCDHIVGPGSSPVLLDGRLLLNMDGGDFQFMLALESTTGATLWRSERDATVLDGLIPDVRKAYSTPIIVQVGGKAQLVSSASQATYGLDPADGRELWRVKHGGFSMSSRPLAFETSVLLNTGFMRPELWSVQLPAPNSDNDKAEAQVNWKVVRGIPSMASPVIVGDELFTVSDGGVASCLDVRTGAQLWKERLGGEFSASLLHADGRVYFFDRDGKTTVIAPGRTFVKLAENSLEDGCMASAAALGDSLIVRTRSHLYRLQRPVEQAQDGDHLNFR